MFQKFFKSFPAAALIVCVFLAASMSLTVAGQISRSRNSKFIDYTTAIDSLKQSLPEMMAKTKALGVAVALVDGDRLVWAEGFGFTRRLSGSRLWFGSGN